MVRGGWTEGERIQRMLSWGKTVLERKKLECKGFLSYVFKDNDFPPECDDRIKIKTLSSIISPPSTPIFFSFSLSFRSTFLRVFLGISSFSLAGLVFPKLGTTICRNTMCRSKAKAS